MRLYFTVSTLFLIIFFTNTQAFSDSEVQSEFQEKVETEFIEKYITLPPKYRETSKRLYAMIYEELLESSWFESDTDMSDAFVTRFVVEKLDLKKIIPQLFERPELFEELKKQIKIQLDLLSKNQVVDTMTRDITKTQIMLKSEAFVKEVGFYPIIEIPRALPQKKVPDYIRQISYLMEILNVKEIAIHSTFISQPHFFIALAKEFQGKGIDINILGYCFLNCATYVSLMAENINITPYGILAYGAFMPAIDKNLSQVLKTNKDHYKNKKDSVKGLVNFITNFFNDIKKRKQMEAFIDDKEQYLEVITTINNILTDQSKEFVNEAFADEIILLLSKNQLGMLEELSNNLNSHTTDSYKTEEQIAKISVISQNIKNHFNSFGDVKSKLDYTLFDFFSFANDITKSFTVDLLYPNSDRKYYAGLERDKAELLFVLPSTSLLRDLGLNVKGNNIVVGTELKKGVLLKLDATQIEKCEVFKENKKPLSVRKCLEGFSEKLAE